MKPTTGVAAAAVDGGDHRLPHLTLDARQAAAAGLGLAEALAVAAADLPRDAQLVQLPLLLLVDLLHAGRFEQSVALLGRVGLQEGAALQAGLAHLAHVLLGDVVHRQLLGLLALLGAVLCQLQTEEEDRRSDDSFGVPTHPKVETHVFLLYLYRFLQCRAATTNRHHRLRR